MDIEEDPDLIYGEEFCFPTTSAYYPTLHAPTGIDVPDDFYERPTSSGFYDQGLHSMSHQAESTSCMYYVVPGYGFPHPPHGSHPLQQIAHPPHSPHPLHPCAVASGQLCGAQEHFTTETVTHTYYQQVRTSHYSVLPSAADMTPIITAQPLACTCGLFIPCEPGQTVAAASERGVSSSPSLEPASVSPKRFQNRIMVPEGRPCRADPWKWQQAGRSRFPAKLLRARQASHHSRQSAVPSVQSSLHANVSYSCHVSSIGSDFCNMSSKKSHQCPETSSYANQAFRFLGQQNLSKPKKPIHSMPSEIIVKSYTSSLHTESPEGEIVLRTDQYNRDDFRVVYPNAKFFVIKSFDEVEVYKSIKYGVWSTTYVGNKKLDNAFREAQVVAASCSTPCPVFLFFSVNQSLRFCGVAEMVGPVDWQKDMDFWRTDKWIGSFPVKWHIIKNVYNYNLRSILLQNNEDKPVTSSRDTQEIHYTPGTAMLKIFKYARVDGYLLDEFMMYEEEEARSSQGRRSKLRQAAPQFMPAYMHAHHSYHTPIPKSSQLMPASTREHQTYNTLLPKSPRFAYQPRISYVKAASDGEQQCLKKVGITPTKKPQLETALSFSFKAPEEYPNDGKTDLVHSALKVPEMISEEQRIIGKLSSLSINSQSSQAFSKTRTVAVAIGSMLIPVTIPN